jgi:hypothetical protein
MLEVARARLGPLLLLALGAWACKSPEQKAREAVDEGRAALQQGKLVEAGQAFERAKSLAPSLTDAVLGEAEVLIKQQNAAHALDVLESCEAAPACRALSQQVVDDWLEAGKRSPLTTSTAKQFVLALRRQEGEKCGLFAALAHANHLKPEQAADRALLRETVRSELGVEAQVSDADPNAPLLQAAAASGKLAGGEEGCDAARQGEKAMLGRMTTLARIQGGTPDALGLSNLGASLSGVYWSNALHERFRTSEAAPAAAAEAAAATSDKAMAWPPQGPGCDAFKKCCEDIGATMPTGAICPLQLSRHGNCDEARRQMGLLFTSSGGELPTSCK